MAEDKAGFVGYCDWLETFSKLEDDEAGRVFKHLLKYVNDLNPTPPDRLTELIFEPIKQQLKRDLKKWVGKKKVKSEDGFLGNLKRWHPDLYDKVIKGEMTTEESLTEINNRKTSVSDKNYRPATKNVANIAVKVNDTVKVNVTDTVTVKAKVKKEGSVIAPLTLPFSSNEFLESWKKLCELKKWKKKEQSSLEASLKKLSKYSEDYAIILIENARAGNYQGVVFSDTDEHYKKYQNANTNQQFTGKSTGHTIAAKKESRDELNNLAIKIISNAGQEFSRDL